MLPPIPTMLSILAQAPHPQAHADSLKQFGQALLQAPERAVEILEQLLCGTPIGEERDHLGQLLGTALDEARMARENGQRRGGLFIDGVEAELDRLIATGSAMPGGRLSVSGAWVRAGLTPPTSLSTQQAALADVPAELEDAAALDTLLDGLLGSLKGDQSGSDSVLQAMFAEMLPTLPPEARRHLVRLVAVRPKEIFGDLGCAWLLDPDAEVRLGALEGLADRLAAGGVSGDMLGRLTILRSWLTDAALRERLDGLVRDAMRKGVTGVSPSSERKLHRIVASLVDGSGAQSLAAAVQAGGRRSVAVLLLKQGFGVKDAYVLPCRSATEQREILAMFADEIEAQDVPQDYLAQAIGIGLGEGLEAGLPPVPGLIEVAQVCGLDGLRPLAAPVDAMLKLVDPEGRIGALSPQARGRLITASRHWPEHYPVLESWFEDSDETIAALEAARSSTALTCSMWQLLERRRSHWAAVIVRNALLLAAAGAKEAEEFIAVAAALKDGRDLKKTPVMAFICDQSILAWMDRREGPDDMFAPAPDMSPIARTPVAANRSKPGRAIGRSGELAKLLQPTGLTETWLEGYLTGACTAPLFVAPSDWLSPLLQIVGPGLKWDEDLTRFVDLLMPRYNDIVSTLREPNETVLLPTDVPLIGIWADGYLTAWEAMKPNWPAQALGPQDRVMRKVLERAADGRADQTAFQNALPAWLKRRFAAQKM